MTFKQELAAAAVRGFMMGIGFATITLVFVLITMIATGHCQ